MTELGSLAEINPPSDPPAATGPVSVIALPDIDTVAATAAPRVVADPAETGSARRTARPGDVLFARISPSMENGKVAIVPEIETQRLVVSGELLILRPRAGVDPRLIWGFLRQRQVRLYLQGFMTGSSGHQRLNSEVLGQVDLPEPEAQRWQQTSGALAHLDRARELRGSIAEMARALPAAAAAAIAATRPRAPLGSFDADFRYGTSARSASDGQLPMLRIPNVVEGRIGLEDLRFAQDGEGKPFELLDPRDLLVVRTNGNPERLGRAAVYESAPERATFASYLIRIRANDLDPDFLWAWLQTAEARSVLLSRARTTAGQYNLNISVLRALPVPRVEPEEEARIAAVARRGRALTEISVGQKLVLDQSVASLLAATFDRSSTTLHDALGKTLGPAAMFLPDVFAAASEKQQDLWAGVSEADHKIEIPNLAESDTDYAWRQQNLKLLEQLGALVRDQTGAAQSWRRPDPELEIIE